MPRIAKEQFFWLEVWHVGKKHGNVSNTLLWHLPKDHSKSRQTKYVAKIKELGIQCKADKHHTVKGATKTKHNLVQL